jgi:hypothetical protein
MLAALPAEWHALEVERPYPVRFSPALTALRKETMEARDGNDGTHQS